jgi:hypothetical protein
MSVQSSGTSNYSRRGALSARECTIAYNLLAASIGNFSRVWWMKGRYGSIAGGVPEDAGQHSPVGGIVVVERNVRFPFTAGHPASPITRAGQDRVEFAWWGSGAMRRLKWSGLDRARNMGWRLQQRWQTQTTSRHWSFESALQLSSVSALASSPSSNFSKPTGRRREGATAVSEAA